MRKRVLLLALATLAGSGFCLTLAIWLIPNLFSPGVVGQPEALDGVFAHPLTEADEFEIRQTEKIVGAGITLLAAPEKLGSFISIPEGGPKRGSEFSRRLFPPRNSPGFIARLMNSAFTPGNTVLCEPPFLTVTSSTSKRAYQPARLQCEGTNTGILTHPTKPARFRANGFGGIDQPATRAGRLRPIAVSQAR